jgi:hypothetical protein
VKYTPEHLEFLRLGYLSMRIPALTHAFNSAFGVGQTQTAIKSVLTKNKYKSGRPPGNAKGEYRMFTAAQADFIREHYTQVIVSRLTYLLNTTFGTQFTASQVNGFVKNHKITSGRDGRFQKGQVSHNKGVKGWQAGGRSAETRFKKGRAAQEARNYVPIGTLRLSKDGYLERKVTDDPSLVPARRWVAEARLVWEAANGPIPEGNVIVFLDGDKTNISLDNLRSVHRSVLAHLNQRYNKLGDTQGDARKAGILVAEVISKAHRRAKA